MITTDRIPAGVAAQDHLDSIEKTDGCWLWPGSVAKDLGYGVVSLGPNALPVSTLAHIWVYEKLVGPIPLKYEIDHLCHNADLTCAGGNTCLHRRCVNPAHLEAVTKKVNNLRRRTAERTKACRDGHERNEENTHVTVKNGRTTYVCRKCHNVRNLKYKQRQRELSRPAVDRHA